VLPDEDKTKEQLMSELALLRQRVAELEASEAERKQAEEALRKSERKYHNFIASSHEVVFSKDRDGHYHTLNLEAAIGLGGTCIEDIEDKTDYDLLPKEQADALRKVDKQLMESGKGIEAEEVVRNAQGEDRIYLSHKWPIYDDEGRISGISCLAIDITERKQAEEALRKSEDIFERFMEHSPIYVFFKDENIRALRLSKNYEAMLGKPVAELLGKNMYDLFPSKLAKSMVADDMGILKEGKTVTVEEELNGRFYSTIKFPIFFGEEPRFLAGYTIDITERKQAEEREKKLQQELSISSRLAAVGELAAGVAHEINNPLTGVLGFSERLLRKSTDEEVRRDLERIHNEAQRITKVMDNLRTFTRRREPEKQYSDINDIVRMTLELRAYELKTGNIEVVTDFTPSLPEVEVDSHQIQEVFLNIILNAEQAMTETHGRGKLTIKTGKIKDYVRISLTDDGPGIPAEHLDRLFDPFFTTRGEQGGTGLGLSVCHSIVTQHGGRLYVKSKPGKGATFFVELPCP